MQHSHLSPQGSAFGWTRAQCDVAFKRDMLNICNARKTLAKRDLWGTIQKGWEVVKAMTKWVSVQDRHKHCSHGAEVYYTAVDHFGHLYYETTSPSWCREHACVRPKGNPNTVLQ